MPKILPLSPELNKLRTKAREIQSQNLEEFPHNCIGKLYAAIDNKADAFNKYRVLIGSATVIAPNILLTAAHCLMDNKNPVDYVEFYCCFPNNMTPAIGKYIAIPETYYNEEQMSWAYDYALIYTEEPIGYECFIPIAEKVNRLGKATSFGYPNQFPFLSSFMCCNHSEYGEIFTGKGERLLEMRSNDMTAGASGGPWIYEGELVGLNSHNIKAFGEDNICIRSPFLDEQFRDFIHNAMLQFETYAINKDEFIV